MNAEADFFRNNLHVCLKQVVSPSLCRHLLQCYPDFAEREHENLITEPLLQQVAARVFEPALDRLLRRHFNGDYALFWGFFHKVSPNQANPNNDWHFDGGIKGHLKLFVYLNAVSEHGCTTQLFDAHTSETMRQTGLVTYDIEKRVDITPHLAESGLINNLISPSLEAGDALLFDPVTLLHRCKLPDSEKSRFTLCFVIVPAS